MNTEIIKEKTERVRGKIGVLFENLTTGEGFTVLKGQDEDVFESASVIKLWIMSCAYEMAEQGKLDLDSTVILKEEDMVPGPGVPDYHSDDAEGHLTKDMFPESGMLNYLHAGTELTVRDLIRLMILISDNTACNIMIDLLGMDNINFHIANLGCTRTILNRRLFDTRPEVRGKENMFSLSEAADFFRKMYKGELVSPEASREMCALLQNQQYTYKMPFFIRQIPIAHKTGEDTGIENDVGIVFSNKPFIFCFASNEADEPLAVRLCQDLALELEVQHGK
ncbi:MAG: serine hydrolase [Clostridiales bacterium]|nr:serine hydrolase [Clostridiales bacterium]